MRPAANIISNPPLVVDLKIILQWRVNTDLPRLCIKRPFTLKKISIKNVYIRISAGD